MRFSSDNNIFLLRRKIVTIFLILSAIFNTSLAVYYTRQHGAIARFFEYPHEDTTTFKNQEFILRDFRKNKYLGEVTDIRNISWNSSWPAVNPPFGFEGAPITNFLVSITGYYLAPQTGYYNMSLEADDYAALFFSLDYPDNPYNLRFHNFTADDFVMSTSGGGSIKLKASYGGRNLTGGEFYPFEIIYINSKKNGFLNFQFIKPDGSVETQSFDRIYAMREREIDSISSLASLNTIYETFNISTVPGLTTPTTVSTSIYTDWIDYYSADVYVFDYVEEPLLTTVLTTTSDISASTTSSFTRLVTSDIDFSTTAGASVPTISSYTRLVTCDIGSSTTAGASVPVTSTYTTVVTGSFCSSSPEVFFNFGVEVEVNY